MPASLRGLTVRHLLVGLAGASICLALAIATFGYWTAGAIADALGRATVASSAAYNFMLGDMMHDALHADSLSPAPSRRVPAPWRRASWGCSGSPSSSASTG